MNASSLASSSKRKRVADDHDATASHTSTPPKRARKTGSKATPIDLTGDSDLSPAKKGVHDPEAEYNEKRLSKTRSKPPKSYNDYYNRAVTQRMFVINRTRGLAEHCPHGTPDCPTERIDLAGTTGNVYTVTITHKPRCTCPNFERGNPQCKHIIYCLVKVLKAPYHIHYQLALLTSELREIFDRAGPLPVETVTEKDKDGRRHDVEGDCAICCEELDEKLEPVVWCKAACGNNLHKACFERWAATRTTGQVTCPYCRTPWQQDGDLKTLSKTGRIGEDGYVNLANELGISGRRDYSTYNEWWMERLYQDGGIDDEDYDGWRRW